MTEHKNEPLKSVAGRSGRRQIVRGALVLIGGAIASVILFLTIFSTFNISIDASSLRGRIESLALDSIGREVVIEGPLRAKPGLSFTVQLDELHIRNPDNWASSDFIRADKLRASVNVLSLLRGEIHINDVSLSGLSIDLQTDTSGRQNWVLDGDAKASPVASTSNESPQIEIDSLSLRDIQITLSDDRSGDSVALEITDATGRVSDTIGVTGRGTLEGIPFALALETGSISEFLGPSGVWPIDFRAEAVGTTLTVNGAVAEPLTGEGAELDLDVTSSNLTEIEALLGSDLPPFQSFGLKGRFFEQNGTFGVADLEGQLGRTTISGDIRFDTSGLQPKLTGALDIPRIDLTPFSTVLNTGTAISPAVSTIQTKSEDNQRQELDPDAPIFTLDALNAFDADFTLLVREVVDPDLLASNAVLKVAVVNGSMSAPMTATIAGVPFNGELTLETRDETPSLNLSLQSESSDVGDLFAYVARIDGVNGGFESASMSLSSRGATIRSAVESSEFRFSILDAALTYGNNQDEPPIQFTLDSFVLDYPAARDARITANGALLSEPFSLEVNGGTFTENFVAETWPVDLRFTGGGAELTLNGALRDQARGTGTAFEFALAGDTIGALSPWTGISPAATSSYALRGDISMTDDIARIGIDEGRVGASNLTGSLGVLDANTNPLAVIELAVDTIDVVQLTALFPNPSKSETTNPTPSDFTIDVPVLPVGLELDDSNIDISIDRIITKRTEFNDVSLSTQIRDGYVENAPLRAVIGDESLRGVFSADLRREVPEINLVLESSSVDVGLLLDEFGVVDNLPFTVNQLDLDLTLRGSNIRSMLASSELTAGLADGTLQLIDPTTKVVTDVTISTGLIRAAQNQPLEVTFDGYLAEIPVEVAITADSVSSFSEDKESLTADLNVNMLNTTFRFSGEIPLPIEATNLRFALSLEGDRVSDLDPLFKASLPPWGPYSITGAFGSRKGGYFIDNLLLGIGDSSLAGNATLDTTQSPPRFTTTLTAPAIQLDDFTTEGWTASEGDVVAVGDEAATVKEGTEALLSPEVMRSLNGALTIRVEQVLSGSDALGSGTLVADLERGKLSVNPLSINIPGGDLNFAFALEPTSDSVFLNATADIAGFDYGVLARRIDPASTTGGLMSLDMDLQTSGADIQSVMSGSNGYLDLAVWPEDMNAGIFDLWAVNVFTAMLPALDSGASKINCVIGRFGIEDGLMSPTALLIDTSRVQATGEGTINFRENRLSIRASPKSKRPEYFSIKTPVAVRGPFDDFKVQLSPFDLTGTAVRMVTSPVVVTFEHVFKDPQPADGQKACQVAWGR